MKKLAILLMLTTAPAHAAVIEKDLYFFDRYLLTYDEAGYLVSQTPLENDHTSFFYDDESGSPEARLTWGYLDGLYYSEVDGGLSFADGSCQVIGTAATCFTYPLELFYRGFDGADGARQTVYSWVSFDGNPPAYVPVPGALPLFITGLLGLGYLARRGKWKDATS